MPIVKHNKLIETSYKLNSREQFFVLYLISKISQSDTNFSDYRMHYSEIEKIINFDGKRRIANKSEVFVLMDKLNSEPIIYERGSVVGKSVWLQHMEHDTETDIFTFSLSVKLREYLLQLKEHFTRYNISNIVYLSANAVRLYEVLKRYQFKGECELTVDKVKFYLGIEDKYPKYYEFKRWVLLPSQREIKKNTDIRFEFVPARKDRKKILSLKFYIYENEPKNRHEIQLLKTVEGGGDVADNSHITGPHSLPYARQQAFEFLKSKGVNHSFILKQIFTHNKFNYQPLLGFEDIYVRLLWKFFSDKTTVKGPKQAGAFVTWWKNGRLTESGLHAHLVELVIERRKSLPEKELDKRLSDSAVIQIQDHLQETSIGHFDLDFFKKQHAEKYLKILQQVHDDYKQAFAKVDTNFNPEKYRKAIEDKVLHECQQWWKNERNVASAG